MIDGRADVFLEVICADVVCIHLRLSLYNEVLKYIQFVCA